MPLLNDDLSLWEIAHRWNNLDPSKIYIFRLPIALKDSFRLMVNAILNTDLESSLIMEKWHPDSNTSREMHIRYYINEIYACIWGQKFNHSLFKSIAIERYCFKKWCELYNIPLPEFWFPSGWKYYPDRFSLFGSDGNNEKETNDSGSKLKNSQKARIVCQQIAEQIWKENPDINITEMVKHEIIKKYGGGQNYVDDTVRSWIKDLAPPHIKGKKGRPRHDKK